MPMPIAIPTPETVWRAGNPRVRPHPGSGVGIGIGSGIEAIMLRDSRCASALAWIDSGSAETVVAAASRGPRGLAACRARPPHAGGAGGDVGAGGSSGSWREW